MIQYYCEQLFKFYGEFLNSSLNCEREQFKNLILFYVKCINDEIKETLEKNFIFSDL